MGIKKGIIITLIVVLVMAAGSYFMFFGGEKMSGDKKVVWDFTYEQYSASCEDLDSNDAKTCEELTVCVADGMVDYLSEGEISELREIVDNEDSPLDSVGEFYRGLEKDKMDQMNEKMMPCLEAISDLFQKVMEDRMASTTSCFDAASRVSATRICKNGDQVEIDLSYISGYDAEETEFVVGDSSVRKAPSPGVPSESFVLDIEANVGDLLQLVPIVDGKRCDGVSGREITEC
jgi:hypothetical protein